MTADPRDLTTVPALKAWLGITATTADDQLQRLVTAVSVGVAGFLGRDLHSQERTETFDGTGSDLLLLRQVPVTAVARVLVDGQELPATSYRMTPLSLVRLGSWWPVGWDNVQVTYTAGYTDVPPDVEQAVLEICGYRWREKDRIGLASKGFGQETTTFHLTDMPESARSVLLSYRRVIPC